METPSLKEADLKYAIAMILVLVIIWMFIWSEQQRWFGRGLENNLALTPPMGWSAWGRFRCNINCKKYPKECISEWLFREMADRMVEDGYLSAGYEYILLDDCWLAKRRDNHGRLQADPYRFPSGMKNLSDYVHSRGLKFGIYGDYGLKTCEGYPGIQFLTMHADVERFVTWGVDYVKLDGCFQEPLDMEDGYEIFGMFLLKMKRPMVYSCSWPAYQRHIGLFPNYTTAARICNSWRNYKDIQDSWSSVRSIMNYHGEHQEEFAPFAGPGHWNDPDMLVIGNFGLSFEQAKSQMVIWAILAAPLIMSHDLRDVGSEFRKLLLNPLIIEINQDAMGIQGKRIFIDHKEKYEVWTKPVAPVVSNRFSWIIAILNLDDNGEPKNILFPLKYTKLRKDLDYYVFVNLFDLDDLIECTGDGRLVSRIPPSGVNIYKAFVTPHRNLRESLKVQTSN